MAYSNLNTVFGSHNLLIETLQVEQQQLGICE